MKLEKFLLNGTSHQDDEWLLLIYIKNNSPDEGIVIEDKTNPEKNYEKTVNQEELELISQKLSNVLLNYKVNGEITDIKPGPVVTLF